MTNIGTNTGTNTGIVVIGRNEGNRLVACLASLPSGVPVIYVDSASTDDSIANAEKAGALIHSLDMSRPFSAARARNEGIAALIGRHPDILFVQFLDGDTVMQPDWLEKAHIMMAEHPKLAAIAGRRREKFPEASWYNQLCDIEWNTPIGSADAVGGDALYRLEAFQSVGGFNPTVIAGEEPELCYRMRGQGWNVHRLDAEMTLHDAAIHSFGPWWKRATRSGYAYSLGALMHGGAGYNVRETLRLALWGAGLPVFAIFALAFGYWPISLGIAALYGVKFIRLRQRFSSEMSQPGKYAIYMMMTNVAEVGGLVKCALETIRGKRTIVEYK